MKRSLSRGWILTALALAILLTALPGAIQKIIATRDPYLFTSQFLQDPLARLSGPGRLRFILQPVLASVIGIRDGIRGAPAGNPPFLSGLLFHKTHRMNLLKSALASVRNLVSIAIILDVVSQYIIFREVHPGAALLRGPVLISAPYSLSRAAANRIDREGPRYAPVGRLS